MSSETMAWLTCDGCQKMAPASTGIGGHSHYCGGTWRAAPALDGAEERKEEAVRLLNEMCDMAERGVSVSLMPRDVTRLRALASRLSAPAAAPTTEPTAGAREAERVAQDILDTYGEAWAVEMKRHVLAGEDRTSLAARADAWFALRDAIAAALRSHPTDASRAAPERGAEDTARATPTPDGPR